MATEFISGALGAMIGAGLSFLTLKYHYRDLYARNISANRMDWINKFREEIGLIVAALNSTKRDGNEIHEAEKARARLLTRLNLDTSKAGNEFNGVMADVLNEIDFEKKSVNSKDIADTLIDLSRKILEPEWQRVKKEAGGDM